MFNVMKLKSLNQSLVPFIESVQERLEVSNCYLEAASVFLHSLFAVEVNVALFWFQGWVFFFTSYWQGVHGENNEMLIETKYMFKLKQKCCYPHKALAVCMYTHGHHMFVVQRSAVVMVTTLPSGPHMVTFNRPGFPCKLWLPNLNLQPAIFSPSLSASCHSLVYSIHTFISPTFFLSAVFFSFSHLLSFSIPNVWLIPFPLSILLSPSPFSLFPSLHSHHN